MQTFLEWFWEQFPDELLGNSDVECYDRVMDLHPIYPKIWYKLGLAYDSIGYKQKAKEYFHRMKQ